MKQTSQSIKYGLLSYDTDNIGDEIQSLAALRFLPKIDYYINRDNIDTTLPPTNKDFRLIMNGWFLDPSIKDNKKHWPPKKINFSPLLISMHISEKNGSTEIFNSEDSIKFLQKFSPVGTRDKATLDYLTTLGIPAYFSGCLTLTLLPDRSVKKQDFILAVDVNDNIYQSIKKRTDRYILRIDTSHTPSLNQDERILLAKYWLSLYQSAHCVITTRLHTMLPSLALGTPVIAISGRDPKRYSGLIDLVNHYTEKEFINDPTINVDCPKPNPKDFLAIRRKIVKTCTDYTGYDSRQSYLHGLSYESLITNPILIHIFTTAIDDVRKSEYAVSWYDTELKNTITKLENTKYPSVKTATKNLLSSIKRSLKNRN